MQPVALSLHELCELVKRGRGIADGQADDHGPQNQNDRHQRGARAAPHGGFYSLKTAFNQLSIIDMFVSVGVGGLHTRLTTTALGRERQAMCTARDRPFSTASIEHYYYHGVRTRLRNMQPA